MDGEGSPSLFEGKNRISAILITLFLSCFAIAILFVFYRQFSGGLERPGVINPWRNTFARTLDQNKEPILWDVYIGAGKVEWEWDGFRVSEPLRLFREILLRSRPPAFKSLISTLALRILTH